MKPPPAGPLDGAARARPGGWLPNPLTTCPEDAIAEAHILLRHFYPGHYGTLRCLAARYRSHVFTVDTPPRLVFKRHAAEGAYLGEVLAYQLLEHAEVLPRLVAFDDESRTLLVPYIRGTVDLSHGSMFDELVRVVARVHTAPAFWHDDVAGTAAQWRMDVMLDGPPPEWVPQPDDWRWLLRLVQDAHGEAHVPIGNLDLKAEHVRRRIDGRLVIVDGETLRPDLTGIPDLVTLAFMAADVSGYKPRRIRDVYVQETRALGADWTDSSLVAALNAFAVATGLKSLHGAAD
ncbi:hypothetical protein [Actinomadura violacea]|uniref:Aminoglycoside phosphotransferase domain-containing protein n=1 Tax=Actinomadura violacea TaxID=2819934 RepID=A0ABS3RXS8_9ACTN|nr:hypothetical protein [Actinomadura violacea]MBO2461550.1 hypothetical protein [Actinomadura violacea]